VNAFKTAFSNVTFYQLNLNVIIRGTAEASLNLWELSFA